MKKQEIEAFKKGWVNIQLNGNIYEFLADKPNGISMSDINDGSMIFRTEEQLMKNPSAEIALSSGSQYYGLVHNADFENKQLLENSEYAVALLQVKPDIPERRDISFESYDRACKYLGDGKKPEADMYNVTHVEPMTRERLEEIGKVNSSSFYKNLGEYMFEKMNNPETLPSVTDGYFGTSASVSNVVLIKEKDDLTALYVESMGFKLLENFMPEPQAEKKGLTTAEKKLKDLMAKE